MRFINFYCLNVNFKQGVTPDVIQAEKLTLFHILYLFSMENLAYFDSVHFLYEMKYKN